MLPYCIPDFLAELPRLSCHRLQLVSQSSDLNLVLKVGQGESIVENVGERDETD